MKRDGKGLAFWIAAAMITLAVVLVMWPVMRPVSLPAGQLEFVQRDLKLPVYPGATVVTMGDYAGTGPSGRTRRETVTLSTSASFSEVVSFYRARLKKPLAAQPPAPAYFDQDTGMYRVIYGSKAIDTVTRYAGFYPQEHVRVEIVLDRTAPGRTMICITKEYPYG